MPVVVSVVLPVFNEQPNLAPVLAELLRVLAEVEHELVAVDDGSTDGSWGELQRLARVHSGLRALHLREHSGQSAALAAGFDAARGDIVVTLDADGQSDPTDIPMMLTALAEDDTLAGVVGYRVRRADSIWKRAQSRVANRVRNWITRDGMRDTGCPLKVIRRATLVGLPRFDGMHRFLPALIQATGGLVHEVPVTHRPRLAGRSKYGMWDRALRGLVDALGVRWYRHRLLRYVVTEDSA
jgi:glycosyltransferase involved in cell wall biosynthesis